MIYTVTLMDEFKNEENAHFSSPVSHKAMYWMADSDWTAGYFTNLDDAINAVKNNELDVLSIAITTLLSKHLRKVFILCLR